MFLCGHPQKPRCYLLSHSTRCAYPIGGGERIHDAPKVSGIRRRDDRYTSSRRSSDDQLPRTPHIRSSQNELFSLVSRSTGKVIFTTYTGSSLALAGLVVAFYPASCIHRRLRA